MTTAELVDKFTELESHIAEEKGPFVPFADRRSVVDYFVSKIKSRLGAESLISLSRIIVIDPQHAAVQALNRTIQVEHGRVEVRDTDFFGQSVKHAYFITSQRPQAPAAATP